MGKFIDLTGQRFGRLVVIERVENDKWNQVFYRCLCDCGKEKTTRGATLINGSCVSCGCYVGYSNRIKHSKKKSEATFNYLFDAYQRGSKKRGICFELSKEEFLILTQNNCHYCNNEPRQIIKSRWNNGDFIYNGIDRIDSSKGYTMENCVPCCGRCNEAKMAESQQDFYAWIDRVYHHIHREDTV